MVDPLSVPPSSSALLGAAQWIQGTLLGTLATTVAVIAIACIGFGMLNGRINIQRGATVIFGCFILFGAPAIASGLMAAADAVGPAPVPITVPVAPPPPPPPPLAPRTPYDPYAGASVPVR